MSSHAGGFVFTLTIASKSNLVSDVIGDRDGCWMKSLVHPYVAATMRCSSWLYYIYGNGSWCPRFATLVESLLGAPLKIRLSTPARLRHQIYISAVQAKLSRARDSMPSPFSERPQSNLRSFYRLIRNGLVEGGGEGVVESLNIGKRR